MKALREFCETRAVVLPYSVEGSESEYQAFGDRRGEGGGGRGVGVGGKRGKEGLILSLSVTSWLILGVRTCYLHE